MFDTVNAWSFENGQPGISLRQLKTDLEHFYTLAAEETTTTVQEHIDSLRQVKREAWRDHDRSGESATVRCGALSVVLQAEDRLMRLSGALTVHPEVQIDQSVTMVALTPELVGSVEYRRRVAALLEILPARRPDGGGAATAGAKCSGGTVAVDSGRGGTSPRSEQPASGESPRRMIEQPSERTP
jgi:hypothetical protein